jgi:hypothetical protein
MRLVRSGVQSTVERYTRSDDGKTLLMTATIQDPWSLREPIVLKKMWRWAPESRIAPYKNCERPTEFKSRVTHSDFYGHGSHIPQKTALNQQTTVDQS